MQGVGREALLEGWVEVGEAVVEDFAAAEAWWGRFRRRLVAGRSLRKANRLRDTEQGCAGLDGFEDGRMELAELRGGL